MTAEVKELVDVCEKQISKWEKTCKNLGIVNINKSYPHYDAMRSAVQKVKSKL